MNASSVSQFPTAINLRRPMYVVARDPAVRLDDLATAVAGRGAVIAVLRSRHLWSPLRAIIERSCPELAESIDAVAADELDDAGRALAEWELEFVRRLSEGGLVDSGLGGPDPKVALVEMSTEVCCWIEQLARAISEEEIVARELLEARAQSVATVAEAWRVTRPLLELHADVPFEGHSHPLLDIIEEACIAMEGAMAVMPEGSQERNGIDCVRNCLKLLTHSEPEHPSIAEVVTDGAIGRADRLFVRLRRMFSAEGVGVSRKDAAFFGQAAARVDAFLNSIKQVDRKEQDHLPVAGKDLERSDTPKDSETGQGSRRDEAAEEPDTVVAGEAGLSLNVSRLSVSYRGSELAFDGKKDKMFFVLQILVQNQGKFVPLSRFAQAPSPWKPRAPTAGVLASTAKRIRAHLRSSGSKHLCKLAAMIESKDSDGMAGGRLRSEAQHAEATRVEKRKKRKSR